MEYVRVHRFVCQFDSPPRVNVGVILCAFIREEMGVKKGKRRMLVMRFNSPHEKACCEEK